ncbi:hypothetical protein SPRG_12926 [Saprolegnia parasitica CBS 223.65]|uniref:Temptin Cys/Cys disulfide domain-containing protein n=1 Tax=Saprolegnia parasitica (strain CBS 223.65) TaxID=695850 RepID=A0A067BWD9_SAPPC|nr:hypothetical protein SPRG_12926 [Saprolegnia parasitica CBS 223.65]KDO21145.1 hypothetical protein SPRG_12926 [Saprolegnia parasitica CBS 223.65]|eukprot:XP_012208144.1 hypothetical protein SPRG_12926 [Saprolegnia parasitica CBS 223.65]
MQPRLVLVLAAILVGVHSRPQYVSRLPNGENVPGVSAIGHVNPSGGGSRNAFGSDFSTNGLAWNTALCQLDSDGDGATNGEELGDPCCTWKAGATLASKATPTHPGVKNMFTTAQLASLKCASSANSTTLPSAGGNASDANTAAPSVTYPTPKPTSGAVSYAAATTLVGTVVAALY